VTSPKLEAVEAPVEDSKITVDMNSLTCGEIEDVETLSGLPIGHAMDPDKPAGKLWRAIACVVRRRTDPSFTWEQSASLKLFFGEDKPVPPTNGRGSSTRSRSRNTSRS